MNLHVLEIFAPQIVIVLTVLALALMARLYPDRQRWASVMICFTGLVVADLAQLKNYPIFFSSAARGVAPGWMIIDPQGWILTLAILLSATVAVLMRRLRNLSGRGDGRFCLSIAISTLAWSLLPAAGSFPVIAACLMIGSIPLLYLSAFGASNEVILPLPWLGILSALAVMLLALWPLELSGSAFGLTNTVTHGSPAVAFPWEGIAAAIFILPMLFWTGCQPLIWWFGNAAGEDLAEIVFFLLLVPPTGSLAALLRIISALHHGDPDSAGVVITAIGFAGILGMLGYGYKALRQKEIRSIAGNMVGLLAATTLVILCIDQYTSPGFGALLVGGVVLYTSTVGLAAGLALGVLAAEKVRTLDQLPEYFRKNSLRMLVFILALISLAGLPPTMGFIQRINLFQIPPHATTFWIQFILAINVAAMILGSLAALRVVGHALQAPDAEIADSGQISHRPRRVRRLAAAPLLLLLLASIVNGAALLAYNPIQKISTAFMPVRPRHAEIQPFAIRP